MPRRHSFEYAKVVWLLALALLVARAAEQVLPEFGQTAAAADQEKRGRENYLVVPAATRLQRHYYKDFHDVDAFIFVNAMDPISKDGKLLNAAAFDFDGLRKALLPLAQRTRPGSVVFSVRCRLEPRRASAAGVLSRSLGQFGRELGLRDAEVDFRRYSGSGPANSKYFNNWEGLVADLGATPTRQAMESEAGMGDDNVMIFPVHTPLSRALFGGEYGHAADCVIIIKQPIETADASILATMRQAVSQQKFAKKGVVMLYFYSNDFTSAETRVAMEEFTGRQVWQDLLGFQNAIITIWGDPPMRALHAMRKARQPSKPEAD